MTDPLDIGLTFDDINDPKQNTFSRRNLTPQADLSGNQKLYPCPNCSSVYNRHDNLTQHLKYVCLQKPRFSCPYCTYVTKRTYNVYGHIRSKHPNCKICYRDLENSNALVTPNLK